MLTHIYLRPLFTNRRSTAPVSTTRRTSDQFPDALTTRVGRPVLGLVGGDSALRAGETQNRASQALGIDSLPMSGSQGPTCEPMTRDERIRHRANERNSCQAGGSVSAHRQPQLTVAANDRNRVDAVNGGIVNLGGNQVGIGGRLAEARIDLDLWFRDVRDPNGPGGSDCTPDELRTVIVKFYGTPYCEGIQHVMQDGAIGFEVIRGISDSDRAVRGERNRERLTTLLRRFRVLDGGKKEATAS